MPAIIYGFAGKTPAALINPKAGETRCKPDLLAAIISGSKKNA